MMATVIPDMQASAAERAASMRTVGKSKWDTLEKSSDREAGKLSILMDYPLSSNNGLKECFTIHKGRKDGTCKKLSTWLVANACDSITMQIVGLLLHGKKMHAAEQQRGAERLSVELAKEAQSIYEDLCVKDPLNFDRSWFQSKAIEDVIKLCWGMNASATGKINEGQLYGAISGYQICNGGLTSYTQSTRKYLTASLLDKVSGLKPSRGEEAADEITVDADGRKSKRTPSRSSVYTVMSKEDINMVSTILNSFVEKIKAETDDILFDPRDLCNKNSELETLIEKFWREDTLEVRSKVYDFSISLLFPRASFDQEVWLTYLESLAATLPKKALQSSKDYKNFYADNEQLLSDLLVYAFVSHVCGCNYRVWNIFSTRRESLSRVNEMCKAMEFLIVNDMEKAEAFGTESPFTKKLSNFLSYGDAFSDKEDDSEGEDDKGADISKRGYLKRSSRTESLLLRARKRQRIDVDERVIEDSEAAPEDPGAAPEDPGAVSKDPGATAND